MSKRWTTKEDQFLFAYGEDMAGFVAEHDLGRPAASGRARWRKLQEAGAIDFMSLAQTAGLAHYLVMGGTQEWDEDALRKVEWMVQNAEAICAAMDAGVDLRKVEVSA